MAATKKKAEATKTVSKKTSKSVEITGIQAGDKVPAFNIPGTKGNISGSSLTGNTTVLYFYPKDDTSGCTAEACQFQDKMAAFKKLGVQVIGVSKDDLKSHEKFAQKYKLNFNLGVDADVKTAEAFGVWVEKSMYGRKYMGMDRATFLIDGKGVVRNVWRKVKVPGHADDVLNAIKDMK